MARRIGGLSHEPEVRDRLLETAVREVAWQLLDEFHDHYRLAEQLAIMTRLAWVGPEAFQAVGIAGPATPLRSGQGGPGASIPGGEDRAL